MFASTRFARSVLKQVCRTNNVDFSNTYTEKTTKSDTKRRSVVFPISGADADVAQALAQAKQAFFNAGFAQTAPKLTRSEYRYGYGGLKYFRVIAYLDN
jgi:hypothetical protein